MFENPHGVPHDEIVRMILENPAEVTAQTVFGKYVESSGLVFTGESIQRMIDRKGRYYPDRGTGGVERPDWYSGEWRILANAWIDKRTAEAARIAFGHTGYWDDRFHTGIDFARQTDYTVIFTIDTLVLPARVVYYKRLNRVPWDTIYAEVGKARALWGPNILCDSTGMGGDVVMDALESRSYCTVHHKTVLADSVCMRDGERMDGCKPVDYLPLSCCDGFGFTGPTKKQLVEHLRNILSVGYDSTSPESDYGWLRVPPIPQLEEEMSFYAWDDKKLTTDSLFGLALACWSGLEEMVPDGDVGSVYGV
jgi:hypothetical protein